MSIRIHIYLDMRIVIRFRMSSFWIEYWFRFLF
jgi:hypothetical protein